MEEKNCETGRRPWGTHFEDFTKTARGSLVGNSVPQRQMQKERTRPGKSGSLEGTSEESIRNRT